MAEVAVLREIVDHGDEEGRSALAANGARDYQRPMSGLAGLLAGRQPPGVYQWHSGLKPDEVQHAVEHSGHGFGYVDGWTHQEKDEFLAEVGAALHFPDDYEHNFDALADCLRDVDAGKDGHEPGTVLLWDGWGPLARTDRRAFDVAVDVFRGRATESPAFSVLLRGEGPSIDVPPLPGE